MRAVERCSGQRALPGQFWAPLLLAVFRSPAQSLSKEALHSGCAWAGAWANPVGVLPARALSGLAGLAESGRKYGRSWHAAPSQLASPAKFPSLAFSVIVFHLTPESLLAFAIAFSACLILIGRECSEH